MIAIWLNEAQQLMATLVATQRRLWCQTNRIVPKHGSDDNWEDDKNGCCAELAVALYTNLFWDGSVGDTKQPDVGGCIEVKSMRQRDYRLVMHKDSHDLPHVCTFVDLPKIELHGWMHASEGKQSRYWCDPAKKGAPAYFVNRPYRPMPDLLDWICFNRMDNACPIKLRAGVVRGL